jgi:DNA-binding SARP family transcriptional activator
MRAHECLSEPSIWHTETEYAVRHAREAVAIEPFRETSYQLLMRAHAAVGNRAEALRVYERCRNLLSEELGVPPSPQTEAVYLDVLTARFIVVDPCDDTRRARRSPGRLGR